MSASALAPPRRLDLLMPDGKWYRTIHPYPDIDHKLAPLFSNHGQFIACGAGNGEEFFVRASSVQALRWVEP